MGKSINLTRKEFFVNHHYVKYVVGKAIQTPIIKEGISTLSTSSTRVPSACLLLSKQETCGSFIFLLKKIM